MNKGLIFVIVLLVLAAILGVYFYSQSKTETKGETTTSTKSGIDFGNLLGGIGGLATGGAVKPSSGGVDIGLGAFDFFG